jgi:Tfp pilus assembly protein PilZ
MELDQERVTVAALASSPRVLGSNLNESPAGGNHRKRKRRQSERLRFSVIARLTCTDGSFEACSTDLSSNGIFVETAKLLPLGTPVQVDFRLFGATQFETVYAQGIVARSVIADEVDDRGVVGGLGIHFEKLRLGEEVLFEFLSSRLESIKAPRPPIPPDKKRPAPRANLSFPVLWGTDPSLGREGFLFNLSSSGAFIGTRDIEPPGTHLYLQFELPNTSASNDVRVTANVVRANPPGGLQPAGMGVAFEFSTVSRGLFDRFLGQRVGERGEVGGGAQQPSNPEGSDAFVRWKMILLLAFMATSVGAVLLALVYLGIMFS